MESGTGLSTLQGTSIHSPVSELDVEGAYTLHDRSAKLVGNMGNTQVKGEPEGATMSGSSSEKKDIPGPPHKKSGCMYMHPASAVRS